jgi:hypothetical protein
MLQELRQKLEAIRFRHEKNLTQLSILQ